MSRAGTDGLALFSHFFTKMGAKSLLYFILAALLVMFLLKRKPLHILSNLTFKWPALFIGSFGAQIALAVVTVQTGERYEFILFITFVCMLLALWVNRDIIGIKWILAGAALNFLAISLFGGLMPVSKSAMEATGQTVSFQSDSRHTLLDTSSPFWVLGDWIPLIRYVVSPGDLAAGIGIFRLIVANSKKLVV